MTLPSYFIFHLIIITSFSYTNISLNFLYNMIFFVFLWKRFQLVIRSNCVALLDLRSRLELRGRGSGQRRRKDVQYGRIWEGKRAVCLSNGPHISLVMLLGLLQGASVLNLPRRGSQDPVYLAEREGRGWRRRLVEGAQVPQRDIGRARRCKASGGTMYDGIEMRLSR